MSPSLRFLVTASASTALVGATPLVNVKTYTIPLTGHATLNFAHPDGGTGDPDGTGSVRLTVNPYAKQVCYRFQLSSVADPMMAHIHQGARLRVGPPVVTLFTGTGSEMAACAPSTRTQLADINADPSDYYVSVDTTEFPDGALRGQL